MLCLFALSMVLSAWALPPDEKKVTLDLKDVPMETFLNTVKQKAGINMLYNSQMFKGVEPVTVKATNEPWKELLDRVLSPKGFTYATKDGIVVIKKKDQKTRTLEGKVVDEQGGELPGVTVLILGKERNIGTMTDADGAFSLGLPEGDVTIRLSFVGMQTLEIHTGKLNLDKVHTFKLKPDSKQLEEVVVTGYAKISKNSFTGTSVTVSADQLMSVSKTNVLGALQTFDPSFRIAENNLVGSNPNNVPELYIRGRSGIGTTQLDAQSLSKTSLKNNPNLPTFIMDGFEISVQKLYDMDPSRIESITILKDAAATAMYGSRAANGVVIITTVTPKAGKVNIDYNFTGTLEYPDLTDYNMMNAREKLETEVAAGMFKAKPEAGASEQNRLDQIYNRKLNNVVRGVDTYWLSKPLRTVFNHKHSLYLDGGTDDLRWGADFSYNSGDGVMKGSYRDRMSGGLSLSYRFGAFQVKNYFSYTYTKSEESPYGSFSDYTSKLPYDEYLDENGNYLETTTSWTGGTEENPLYEYYDEILDICEEYDVTISLGDACRPGCLADATDVCQIEELVRLGELTKRAWDHNVQVMVEGPGHVPLDQVAANMKVQQSICMGAPFYVLGPLVTDIAPGYDHITAAIGGAVAAMNGAAFLCYVTPAEHLALPNVEDTKQGIIASKIAAHAADIAKGIPGARDIDDRMAAARQKLDWDAQYACALDPETAKAIRDSRSPEDDHSDTCSMCGKFCAVRSMNKALAGEYIDIL